ncbi:15823_t:CDS:1, partial [Racocetra persica]
CCKENRQIYYLLKPPHSVLGCQYNSKNLPLQRHENYLQDIVTIEYLNRLLRKRKVQER